MFNDDVTRKYYYNERVCCVGVDTLFTEQNNAKHLEGAFFASSLIVYF